MARRGTPPPFETRWQPPGSDPPSARRRFEDRLEGLPYEAIRFRFLRGAAAYAWPCSDCIGSGVAGARWSRSYGRGRGHAHAMAKVAKAAHRKVASGEAHAAVHFAQVGGVVAQESCAYGGRGGRAHVLANVENASHRMVTCSVREAHAAVHFAQVGGVVAQESRAYGRGGGQVIGVTLGGKAGAAPSGAVGAAVLRPYKRKQMTSESS